MNKGEKQRQRYPFSEAGNDFTVSKSRLQPSFMSLPPGSFPINVYRCPRPAETELNIAW